MLSIYAGTDQRYNADLYNQIKPLKNYTNPEIQKNLIGLTSNLSRASNVDVARMLGLPKKDIELLQDLQKATSQLGDFKIAGDHTDIKAIMSNFPNYKKNFMKIQYVSNDLNTLKSTYDKKIIALYNSAKAGAAPETIVPKLEEIQNDFKTKTGYDIGGFSFKKNGKIAIDPQTVAINEYRYPINDNVIKTMGNIEAYENKKYTNPLDKEVMANKGSPNKLEAVYEKYKGNVKVINNSKYVKGLDNVPKLKGFKNALLYGGAGTAAIFATAANADTNDDMFAPVDPGVIVPQEDKKENSVRENAPAIAGGAASLGRFGPGLLKGALKTIGSPVVSGGFAVNEMMSEDPNMALAGAELLLPEIYKQAGNKIPKGFINNVLGLQGIKTLVDKYPMLRKFKPVANLIAKSPRVMTPVGLTLIAKDIYDEFDKTIGLDQRGPLTEEELLDMREKETYMGSIADAFDKAYKENTPLPGQEGIETLKQKFALGGRIGFADGPEDPSKRKLMKIMGGLASIPILGRFIDIGTQAPKVAEVVKRSADGVPEFLMDLIAKVKLKAKTKGMEYFTGNKPEEFKDVYQVDNYVVTEKGNKTIIREIDQDGDMLYKENQMELDYDPETGGYTYNEASARPDAEGKLKDVEEYIEEDDLENMRKYTYDE